MPTPDTSTLANAVRFLSIDAVERAQSGHPGMPMGLADVATVLWRHHLRHDPAHPQWANRDRFVVSNGHGSMLLYACLHLSGYDLSTADLQAFRALHSRTPGHPEWGITPGVETTTGPLGQGLAHAVGMALAERTLAAQHPDTDLIDHRTYVFAGDGCLMEGVSHEACSLAGTLGLGKLIVCFDDNGICIDGRVEATCQDNVTQRFEAYGWQVIGPVDGHDHDAIDEALQDAADCDDRPSLVRFTTRIGYGCPMVVDHAKAHGAPLGPDAIAATRETLNWPHPPFHVPDDVRTAWDATETGAARYQAWQARWEHWADHHPDAAHSLGLRLQQAHHAIAPEVLEAAWSNALHHALKTGPIATRRASQQCLEHVAPAYPGLFGGSADLTAPNGTLWDGARLVHRDHDGQYLHYGVREFAMGAMMAGMALHGGFLPFGGTFLTFSDYMRNAIRLTALMSQRVVFVMTHDSIGLGEDGPTHQPVEQLSGLRAMPNLDVWRPADAFETVVAWHAALHATHPSVLALSRQTLPSLPHGTKDAAAVGRGAYRVDTFDQEGQPDGLLFATGSEVHLALAASERLHNDHQQTWWVYSVPCMEAFQRLPTPHQDAVVPPSVTRRVAIEAGHPMSWFGWVNDPSAVMGLERFGESAPGDVVMHALGFHTDAVVERALQST